MQVNESVWNAYQPGYVYPEFVPYLNYNVPFKPNGSSSKSNGSTKDSHGNDVCSVNINKWQHQGPETLVNPELVRKNWGMSFMMKHPKFSQCPPGWIKGEEGWCVAMQPENEAVFYTNKAFVPKIQYWDNYTNGKRGDSKRRISESTDMRSVNPLNGEYTVYYEPKETKRNQKYGLAPSKDSYL
jgi:hypothetical protein